MDKPWKVILAFIGVFMAGAIFGGVFTLRASAKRQSVEMASSRPAGQQPAGEPKQSTAQGQPPARVVAQPRGNPITPVLMRQYVRRLNLTADQKERISPVVSRAGEDYLRLSQENFANTQRVTERMYADVSAVLSPEQRGELETMRRELQEKLQTERQRVQAERQKKADSAPEGANRVTPPPRAKDSRPAAK